GDAAGMGLRIRQRKRRTPTATEYLPSVDAEFFAQQFDVTDKVPGGVVDEVCVRRRTAAATLVEQDDPVLRGIVEPAHLRAAAGARAAMKQHHRLALRIAALLVIQRMAAVDLQGAAVVAVDLGIKGAHGSGSPGNADSLANGP